MKFKRKRRAGVPFIPSRAELEEINRPLREATAKRRKWPTRKG